MIPIPEPEHLVDDPFDESMMVRARAMATEIGDPFVVLRAAIELFADTISTADLAEFLPTVGEAWHTGRVSTNAMEIIAAARVPGTTRSWRRARKILGSRPSP